MGYGDEDKKSKRKRGDMKKNEKEMGEKEAK